MEFWVGTVGQVENFQLALASIWPVEVRESRESCESIVHPLSANQQNWATAGLECARWGGKAEKSFPRFEPPVREMENLELAPANTQPIGLTEGWESVHLFFLL